MKGKVSLKDFGEYKARLEKLAKTPFADEYLNGVFMVVDDATKKNTPVDTGVLKGSWKGERFGRGEESTLVYYSDVEYAPYVEYGHRTTKGGWVDGQWMLTLGKTAVKRKQQKIFNRAFDEAVSRI